MGYEKTALAIMLGVMFLTPTLVRADDSEQGCKSSDGKAKGCKGDPRFTDYHAGAGDRNPRWLGTVGVGWSRRASSQARIQLGLSPSPLSCSPHGYARMFSAGHSLNQTLPS